MNTVIYLLKIAESITKLARVELSIRGASWMTDVVIQVLWVQSVCGPADQLKLRG